MLNAIANYDDIDGIVPPAQNPTLVGHGEVMALLDLMLAANHLHHALLFEGPQGIGKATLGFHLAHHMLNNGEGGLQQIDTDCADWRQITIGAHPGLLHISRPFDSKSQKFRAAITVEEIRKVSHFLHQTAAGNGWRIVMIDSADDMNRNAANALLKTLEEPPSKALFILISHHRGRLLPTLRSRCQTLHFNALGEQELHQALARVASGLGFGEDEDNDAKIIKAAEGSVRKAVLMLSHGGLEITNSVESILALPRFDIPEAYRLATALGARDAAVQFTQFVDYLLRLVGEAARETALADNSGRAERLSCLYQQLSDEMMEAQAYNLDKKHFVIVTLNKVHNALFA